jgi:tetratricopeptide (TPR) repeat protein
MYLLKTVGVIESGMGLHEDAETHLREALAIEDSLTDADRQAAAALLEVDVDGFDNRVDILKDLGVLLLRQGRAAEAEGLLDDGQRMLRSIYGDEHPRSMEAMLNHAAALRVLGRLDEARDTLDRVLAGQRRLYAGPHRMVAITLGTLANVASSGHQHDRAAELWAQAEAEAVAALGEDHPWIASVRLAWARALHAAGRRDESVPLLRALAAMEDREDELPARAAALLAEVEAR